MASAGSRSVADLIHHLGSPHTNAETQDEELLRRFGATGDADAFELLLWRHERMVMGVCRRVLRNRHDAEDAFQASFLVLARKARSIAARRAVTTWLYTVAYRVALNALKERMRRQARVGPLPDGAEPVTPKQPDLGGLIDEAVNSLPARYRGPVVLCLLEGRSHTEAARVLSCAAGTVASRLARAKARLRGWLGRHGVGGLAGALAATSGASSASPRSVISITVRSARAVRAGGAGPTVVSPLVLALAQGALGTMFKTRILQSLAVVLAAVVVWGAGRHHSTLGTAAEMPVAPQAPPSGRPEPSESKAERLDALGDPLPSGAVARLGSLRFHHNSIIRNIVLSADGKWVVASDNIHRLWDALSGKESPLNRDLRNNRDFRSSRDSDLKKAMFFATEERLVAVKTTEGRIALWDVAADKEAVRLPADAGPCDKVALSADGKTLVFWSAPASRDGEGRFVFADAVTGAVRRSVSSAVGKRVMSLSLSLDGSALATHYADNIVEVWDVKAHAVILSVALKGTWVGQVGLSPNGGTLAAASHGEKQIRLWDVRANKESAPLAIEHGQAEGDVSFSPDGEFLAATYQTEVGLWDLTARTEVRRLKANGPSLRCPVFSRDGKRLAAADGTSVILWDLATGRPCHDLGHSNTVDAVAFAPDGRTIASGSAGGIVTSGSASRDNVVRTWDALTGQIKGRWLGHTDGIEVVAYSPDGRLVASGSRDGTVRLWDAEAGKEVGCLDAQDGTVTAMAFSPDGKTLASGGKRKIVHLWDVATFREARAFDGEGLPVRLAFSPDGKTLATREHGSGLVRLWDSAAGTERHQFRDLGSGHPQLSFAPDGRTLAVNCDDFTVHLLDVTTGREIRVLGESRVTRPLGAAGGVGGPRNGTGCMCVAFAPDGRSLAAGYHDLSVRLWETASGRERTHFQGHAGFAMGLAYSPDGSLLVTGGTDRTALVWDVYGLRTSDRKKAAITREDAERLWADLADADAGRAFRATQAMRANGATAVKLLNEHLRPATAPDREKITRLIADLDRDNFTARESATKQLSELGELAEPALHAALNDKTSSEMRRRVEDLLKRLDASNSPELMRCVRAVEVLENLDTPEARQVLQALAQGAAEARLTREAKAARERQKR
jgi:RNA polymerase sigma factor (sigma-70 family)